MVKRWFKRIQLMVAFIHWNILALLFALWCALDDVMIYWKRYRITPKEFAQCWKNLDRPKEEPTDAD